MVTLKFESIDTDEEVKTFVSLEAAISYACWWFINGYVKDRNLILPIDDITREGERLIKCLQTGEDFFGHNFFENIEIVK